MKDGRLFADGLSHFVFSFCNPIIIGRHPDVVGDENALVFNATGTLVAFSGKPRLVTMKHVLDVYRTKKAEDPRTVFAFGGLEFDPLAVLVAESEDADLAVLDTSGARFERDAPLLPALAYFTPGPWPPATVAVGDKVFLGGWPEDYRELRDGGRDVFSKPESLVGIIVTEVQANQFICTLDRSNWSQSRDRGPQYLNEPIGSGFSGSPVFRETMSGAIFIPELVGFLKGAWTAFDSVVISHAHAITEDGALAT